MLTRRGKHDSFMLHDGSHSDVGNAMCFLGCGIIQHSKVRRVQVRERTKCIRFSRN